MPKVTTRTYEKATRIAQDSGETQATLTKKEKRQSRHDLLLQNLSRQPYSKSHSRRLKRKQKDQLITNLEDIQAALADLNEDDSTPNTGQLGPGKTSTLSKAQRKRVLQMESLRQPLILASPQFSSSPFEAIRTHAQTVLSGS